jgi:predicted MFS family arabinose efflux permease
VVSTWFSDEHERRFAVGAYNTAPVLGGMATLVLSNSVFMPLTGSWRLTVAFESAAMLVAVTAWLVVTRRKPPTAAMPAPGDGSDGLRSLLADPRVRTVLVLALGFFFIAHGLAGWLPSVLREHNGFSPMAAANWTAVSGAVGIVTSLTLPRRATRERLPILMAGTLVVVALGLMAVVAAPTFLVPVPMVAIGVRYALIPLTIVTLMDSPAVGPRNMGQAFGLFFAVAEVGGVTGPLIVGRVADTAVGFGGALVLVGAVCVLLLVAVARLSRLDADEVGSARPVTGS